MQIFAAILSIKTQKYSFYLRIWDFFCNFARKIGIRNQNETIMRRFFFVALLCAVVQMVYSATPGTGVFTVNGEGKTVRFASSTETGLHQWADAVAIASAAGSGWTMLTGAEWSYLLASGRASAADKNALGTVNGVHGLIILPDDWTLPDGLSFTGNLFHFDDNTYTAEQWTLMANAGAVFLPAGGYGYNDPDDGGKYKELDQGIWGAYWADEYELDNTKACSIHFQQETAHDCNHYSDKTVYYSVILVRDASEPVDPTILDEVDELAAYTTKWTAAKEEDYAYVRRTLKKDGTFYTLCLPFDVPDIEASPLAGAEVFTFDGGSVSGTEGNEVLNLEMTHLAETRLSAGVPYILRWSNTGETLASPLYFSYVENWDDDTDAGTDPGNETIKFHGVYPRAHIPGYETGNEPHYNFFMGANNTLYWPDDSLYPDSKMKGFRAYFYIIPGGGPNPAPVKRGMQAVWKIKEVATGTQNTEHRAQTEKQLRSGQLYIMYEGQMYDVMGNKVERMKE